MSTYTTNASARPLFGTVFAAANSVIEAGVHYYQYRKTVSELSKLSATELTDLGLNKGTIKAVAMEAVYGA